MNSSGKSASRSRTEASAKDPGFGLSQSVQKSRSRALPVQQVQLLDCRYSSIAPLDVNDAAWRQRHGVGGLLAFPKGDNEKYATRPGGEHIGDRKKFQHERGKQQGMETDEPPDQNHRRDIQQFVAKCPAQRTEQELDHIGHHSDRVSTPDAISRQERYLEQLLEKVGHLIRIIRST